ncbi:MAG: hypothetical protein ACYC1Q_08740 [Bacteroidia bacterium]
MKKYLFLTVLACTLWANRSTAQYRTSGGEVIFSFADYRDSSGMKISGPPRFTVFFHINHKYNFDISKSIGIAFGLSIKNVGWITKNETYALASDMSNVKTYEKIKRRSYTLGVPLMIKLGNMKKDRFLALGAEYELLFHFKEKRFIGGEKFKRSKWISDETNRFLPSVFVGLQFTNYGMIKFQYYLDDFLNTSYKNPMGDMPYAGTTSRMMFISWMGNIRADKFKKPQKKKKSDKEFSAQAQFLKSFKLTY